MYRKPLQTIVLLILCNAALFAQNQTQAALAAPRLQAIHGIPDPALDSVDVYISIFGNVVQEIQDIKFRQSSPMSEAIAIPVDVGIAPGNSGSVNDVIQTFSIGLQNDRTYIGVARGVQNPANFAPNPDGINTGLDFTLTDNGRTVSTQPGQVQFIFAHIVSDAPTVDLVTENGEVLVDNIPYGGLSGYITRPPGTEVYQIVDPAGTVLKSFEVDLSPLANEAFTMIMSGFNDPAANQNGNPLGLHGVFANSDVTAFPVFVSNQPPVVANPIPDLIRDEDFASFTVADLNSVFSDDAPGLTFSAVTDGNTTTAISGSSLLLSSIANLSGTSTVIVTADDGEFSASDTFTVTINPVNDPPTLAGIPDVILDEDSQTTLDLNPYFSDVDNANSEISLVAAVVGDLDVVINPATRIATFSGTPDSSGIFSVVFTATDPGSLSDTDTISVTVNPVNDAPTLSGIPDLAFDEDSQATLALNDYVADIDNPDGDIAFSAAVISAAGGSATSGIMIDPQDLEITIDPTTHVATFTATMDTAGSFTVVFTATDPGSLADTDTITVSVNALNDAPLLSGIPDVSFDEDSQTMLALNDYVSDADHPDEALTLTAAVIGATSATLDPNDLSVTIDPATHEATFAASPDSSGQFTVVFTAADPAGLSDSDTIQVTVTPVNDAPLLAGIPDVSFDENSQGSLSLNDYVTDIDNAAAEIGFAAAVISASPAPIIGVNDLDIAIDPTTNIATFSASLDTSGLFTVVFTATDPGNLSGSDTISVSVMATNNDPVLSGIPDVTIDEDLGGSLELNPYVNDIDNSPDEIAFSARVIGAAAFVDTGDLTVSIDSTSNTASFSSTKDSSGVFTVVFTATDPGNQSDTDTIQVTVLPVNDPPELSGIPDVIMKEDAQVIRALNPFLSDVDNTIAELTLTAEAIAVQSSPLTDPDDLMITINQLNLIFYSASPDSFGVFTVVVTASDPGGQTGSDTLIVTVQPVNDGPVLSGIPDISFDEDFPTTLELDPYATDIDNQDDELTLTAAVISAAPPPIGIGDLTVDIDPATHIATFTNTPDSSGIFTVRFTVRDPEGLLTDTDTITVTVNPYNDVPLLSNLPDVSFDEDSQATLTLSPYASDVDNDVSELTYAATVIGASAAAGIEIGPQDLTINIDPATTVATFTTTMDSAGVFTAVFYASDPGGQTGSDTITVTVNAINDGPVLTGIPDVTFDEDVPFTLALNPYLEDPDNVGREIRILTTIFGNGNLEVTIDQENNIATFTNTPDSSGSFTVVFTAIDTGNLTDTDTISVTVNPVNDAPRLAGLPDVSFDEDSQTTLALGPYAADVDNTLSELSFAATVIGASAAAGIEIGPQDLTISIDPVTTVATFATTMDTTGEFTAVFTVSDPAGLSGSDTISVTVSPVNDGPVLAGIPDISFDEDTQATLALNPFVSDVDHRPEAITFFATVIGAAPASIDINDLVISINPDTHVANFSCTPDSSGSFTVVFIAVDPGNLADTDTISVTVDAVNDAPRLAGIPDLSFDEDGQDSLALRGYAGDVDHALEQLTFSGEVIDAAFGNRTAVGPEDLQIDIDPASGRVHLRTTADTSGVFAVSFTATDPGGLSGSDTITVTVNAVNDPPTLVNPIADVEVTEDSGPLAIADLNTVFADIDNALSYTASTAPGIEILLDGSQLSIMPAPDYFGMASVVITADDGFASIADTFVVTVTGVNDTPTAFALLAPLDSTVLNAYFSPVDFLWAGANDVDGDPLSYAFYLSSDTKDTVITGVADTLLSFSGNTFWESFTAYNWWVIVSDGSVEVASTDTFVIQIPLIESIEDDASGGLPQAFALEQNYPNPFNPSTTIHFALPVAAETSIVIYNSAGQRVRTLAQGRYPAGRHQLVWDGRSDAGQQAASGLYFYSLRTNTFSQVNKMLLLK